MKKALLFLFFAFLVLLPVSSADTISVSLEDWQKITAYVEKSVKTLEDAQSELTILKQDLQTSQQKVSQLLTQYENTSIQLERTKSWNKLLIGSVSVSIVLNVVLIIFLVK